MPDEEIAPVANMIRNCAELSSATVEEYLNPLTQEQKNDVLSILSKNSIKITNKSVFELSEERISELEKEYKDRPYVDVLLTARSLYKGLAN